MRRTAILSIAAVAALTVVVLGATAAASARQSELDAVRSANARFHSIEQAEAAGYGAFYVCTQEPGVGAMGQHYVNGDLVADPAVDPLHPEALVYEPTSNGGYRLVAIEYVVLKPTLPVGAPEPTVFGQALTYMVGTPVGTNRYGLPEFYQRHVWLYKDNPSGTFADWNPNVSCGDDGSDEGTHGR